jgi:hypothetical protein
MVPISRIRLYRGRRVRAVGNHSSLFDMRHLTRILLPSVAGVVPCCAEDRLLAVADRGDTRATSRDIKPRPRQLRGQFGAAEGAMAPFVVARWYAIKPSGVP